MRGRCARPSSSSGGQVGEREHLAEGGELGPSLLDLVALLVVLAEHADRLGVLEHVLRVRGELFA